MTGAIVDNGNAILNKIDKITVLRETDLKTNHIVYLSQIHTLNCTIVVPLYVEFLCFFPLLWAFIYTVPVSEIILFNIPPHCSALLPPYLCLNVISKISVTELGPSYFLSLSLS